MEHLEFLELGHLSADCKKTINALRYLEYQFAKCARGIVSATIKAVNEESEFTITEYNVTAYGTSGLVEIDVFTINRGNCFFPLPASEWKELSAKLVDKLTRSHKKLKDELGSSYKPKNLHFQFSYRDPR